MENFATVERLDLLADLYGEGCAWTEAVALEIRRGAKDRPHLRSLVGATWLGTPVGSEDPLATAEIFRIRRALGGSTAEPNQHLGEAESIYHASRTHSTGAFATDDQDAYTVAQRRGLFVIDTPDILRACYEAGIASCPEAYELLQKMAASGRGVTVPPSHWWICP